MIKGPHRASPGTSALLRLCGQEGELRGDPRLRAAPGNLPEEHSAEGLQAELTALGPGHVSSLGLEGHGQELGYQEAAQSHK